MFLIKKNSASSSMYVYSEYTYIHTHHHFFSPQNINIYTYSIMVQLYEDKETKDLLDYIRKENPEINLSELFKKALNEYKENSFGEDKYKLIKLNKMLERCRFEKAQAENEIVYLLEEINIEKQRLIKIEEEEKIAKERQNKQYEEHYKEAIININLFFKDLLDPSKVSELAREYISFYYKDMNIFDYMETKGFKREGYDIPQKKIIKKVFQTIENESNSN